MTGRKQAFRNNAQNTAIKKKKKHEKYGGEQATTKWGLKFEGAILLSAPNYLI